MTAETSTPTSGTATTTATATTGSGSGSVRTVYQVTGMTCGHCEGAVSGELSGLPGVASVEAVAATGLVTVVSASPLDDEAVRAAVDEAGYELVGRA